MAELFERRDFGDSLNLEVFLVPALAMAEAESTVQRMRGRNHFEMLWFPDPSHLVQERHDRNLVR